jgi:hypothetical protein
VTLYTDLYPPTATIIARTFWHFSGNFNVAVPVGATYMRAGALGCGGLSTEAWGGGGALARSLVPVVAGENIKIQVGSVSTGGVGGNSSVLRNDNTIICLADRGRGVGAGGLAANSIGQVTRSGSAGASNAGGASASDAADPFPMGFGSPGATVDQLTPAGPGGGGRLQGSYNVDSDPIGYWEYAAGPGLVCIEFFDKNPGYV